MMRISCSFTKKNARTKNDALPTVSQKTLNSIDDVDNELLRSIEKGPLKKLVIAYDLELRRSILLFCGSAGSQTG